MKLLTRDRKGLRGGRARTAIDASEAEMAQLVETRLSAPGTPGSVVPRIRTADASDRGALEEMVARCSPETLGRRFHSSAIRPSPSLLARLAGRRVLVTLVADVDGAAVGIASLHRGRNQESSIAVLVEDAWQHSGVGHGLTAELISIARARRLDSIVADVAREPDFVLRSLTGALRDATVDFDGPTARVRIPVTAPRPTS